MATLSREEIAGQNQRATSLYRAGNRDEAAQVALLAYTAARELDGGDPLRFAATQTAAALSELVGQAEAAITLYREIAASNSEDSWRAHAHERLFELHRARAEWVDAWKKAITK